MRASLLAIVISMAAGSALAQASNTASTRALEEIVVTADRREGTVLTTPLAITALSGNSLADRGIVNTKDLTREAPNLFISSATAGSSTIFVSLRGSYQSAGGISTFDSPIGVYVDDVYQARVAALALDFVDLDRIEILRGPQGTLYGRNSVGGAIKIVTRAPTETLTADLSLSYGSFDTVTAKGVVSDSIVPDALAGSVSAFYYRTDGYQYNAALQKDVGAERRYGGRGKLALIGRDDVAATLSVGGFVQRGDGYVSIPITYGNVTCCAKSKNGRSLSGDIDTQLTPVDPYSATDQWNATLDISVKGSAVTFRSITGYIDVKDAFRADFNGGTITAGRFTAGFDRSFVTDNDQFSQEIQLLSAEERPLRWIAGAYFFREAGVQIISDRFAGGLAVLPTTLDTRTRSLAVFAEAGYDITDRLKLTAGARWSQDNKAIDATIQNGFAFPFTLTPVAIRKTFSSLTPKLALDYRLGDGGLVYGYVARGFQAGGFNGLAVADPAVLRSPYEPQTLWAGEVGVKGSALDKRVRLSIAAFYNRYSKLQQTAQINTQFSFAIQNVGQADVYGLEAEMTANLLRGLNARAAVGLQHDRYVTLNPRSTAAINNARDIPFTPSQTISGGLDYRRTTGDWIVGAGMSGSYSSPYFSTVDVKVQTSSIYSLDGYLSLSDAAERFAIRLVGRNILDDRYILASGLPGPSGLINAPRSIRLELNYKLR